MADDLILLDIADGVADLRLNRPDKMNAITVELLEAMAAAGERLAAAPGLRAVVLRGEGRAFCAGLDKQNFASMAQTGAGGVADRLMERTHGEANLFQHASHMWRGLPVPVVCAVHGVALGGGFQIMLGADIRIAAPDARFSIMEMKWGLVPDMGMMALAPRLARMDVIRKLTYTAEMFDAEAALGYGFVTELAEDPAARAGALAAEIAAKSPAAVRAAKALLNMAETGAPAEVLRAESERQKSVIGTPEQIETVMANVQNRKPNYR